MDGLLDLPVVLPNRVVEKSELTPVSLERVRPLKKYPILVEVLPRYENELNPLKLTLVDKQKHFEGKVRRGRVTNVRPGIESVKPGDVVLFEASDGFTLDGEAVDPKNPLKGESYRWLRESECMALEERLEVPA